MYKRLGDYVHEVDVRNTDLSIKKLVGVNLQKEFMPSVANIIGTDLSRYKVIRYNQFGLKLMSVERDRKMPISLMKDPEPSIISTAYFVFEVNSEEELMPDYLFLQIKQPEFDRRLWFSTGGDVRGGATWDNLMDMPIVVPPISEQKIIVSRFQALDNRISINEKLIAKMEETERAIYKKRFVDDINPSNLPAGWRMGCINEIALLKVGGDKPAVFSEVITDECQVPVYANGTDNEGIFGYTNKPAVFERSVTITARGTIGCCFLRKKPFFPIVRLIVVQPKEAFFEHYLFHYYSTANLQGDGSVQSQLTVPQLLTEEILIPEESAVKDFHDKIEPIDSYIDILKSENQVIASLQHALLSKMS